MSNNNDLLNIATVVVITKSMYKNCQSPKLAIFWKIKNLTHWPLEDFNEILDK